MSRYSETVYILSKAEKEGREIAKYEATKQIAISLAQIVDILKKDGKKSSKE